MKTFKYIVVATLMLGASLPSMGQVVRRSERDKDKKESKDANAKNASRALEVGAVIISGAAAVSYFVFLFLAQ